MRITLIQPPTSFTIDELTIPLNLLSLATYLKSRLNIVPKILDFDLFDKEIESNMYFKQCEQILKKDKSKIYGITCMYHNILEAINIAQIIRKHHPDSKIIFGGPHVTFIANELVKKFNFIDYVIRGEGERTLYELVKCLREDTQINDIKGLTYKNTQGNPISFEKRPLIKKLDDLPLIDYSIIDIKKYLKITPDMFIPILAGSGCPYNCTFCSTTLMWERKYRVKSPERIKNEVTFLAQKYNIRNFGLVHDNITVNRKFIYDLSNMLGKYKYNFNLNSRCDNVDANLIKRLKKLGTTSIFIGIESASRKVQKYTNKNLRLDNVYKNHKLCLENNIAADYSFMFGFPFETPKDFNKTIKMAFDLKVKKSKRVNLHLLVPHHGTDIEAKYSQNKKQFNKYVNLIYRNSIKKIKDINFIKNNIDIFKTFYMVKNDNFEWHKLIVYQLFDILLSYFSYSFWYLFFKLNFMPSELSSHINYDKCKKIIYLINEGRLKYRYLEDIVNIIKLRYKKNQHFQNILKYDLLLLKLAFADNSSNSHKNKSKDNLSCDSVITFNKNVIVTKFNIDILKFVDILIADNRINYLIFSPLKENRIEIFEINKETYNLLRIIKRKKKYNEIQAYLINRSRFIRKSDLIKDLKDTLTYLSLNNIINITYDGGKNERKKDNK